MSVHAPKHITSHEGLGVNTLKSLKFITSRVAIGTEVWGELKEPWTCEGIIIAEHGYTWRTRWEVGKPFIITKFFDDKGELVGVYCDICRPVVVRAEGFAFDDLYLDVWMIPGTEPVLLDDDELSEAIAEGFIGEDEAETARLAALELMTSIQHEPEILNF